MTPGRWRQIEDIFQEALDLAPENRARFIDEKCAGDAELRAEVEKLVARYETEENFLESPVWTDSQFLQSQAKREIAEALDEEILLDKKVQSFSGRQIGAYRLTEELGKGGMGVVYLAERADGEFQQKVAVKLIKRGMDTDFIVKRFRHERQILANLNHPNIARLLDGGTTEDGSPYFIMEYIEGEPINKFCQTHNLGLRRKLELFLQACQAITHAHKRKIIHRDIKPSNILVTADGNPKLLDFGIAKILDPDSIHESIAPTATAMRLMTPEYASPEQARGEEITPASDQYSLGVLLYELITGSRPYKFPSRAPHEIARVICEEIPSEPSSGEFGKLVTGAEFPFDSDFCKKLDGIVLKTLRKNPAERYASVEAFAADINRFLRNENVLADSLVEEEKIAFHPEPLVKLQKEIPLVAHARNRTNDTVDAPSITAQNEKTITPRGRGVRQGLFLIILSFLSLPILTAAIVLTEIPPILQFFIFVILLFAGIIRVVYALILEPGRKQLITQPDSIFDSAANLRLNSLPADARPNGEVKTQPPKAETPAEKKSIAVLPLKNLNTRSGEETGGSEFLSVGLADALITRLSNVRQFVVRPTSSVLRFGDAEAESFAAGRELNVNFIVEGNILKTGDRIRVSVQLLNVAEQSTVWAERFDENYTDVLSLEDSISSRVAESLVPQLSTAEARKLAKRATDNAEAYKAYLRGRAAWSTFSESGLREAIGFYRKAIELDPRYAQAHAAIADYHIWLGIYGGVPPGQTYPAAKAAARRALELDGGLAEAYAALGLAQIYSDFDWRAGEENMLRALRLNPNNSTAHLWRSHPLLARHDFDEAIKHVKRSIELDPTSFPAQIMLAYAYYFARRYDQAVSGGNEILAKFPEYSYAFLSQSSFLRAAGRYDEAISCARRALALSDDSLFVTLIYAQTLAAAGEKVEAENILSEVESQTADKFFSYYLVAIVHCYLKEKDRAFAALEKAVDKRDGLLIWVGNDPSFNLLRDDARYQSLLEKINHPLAASAKVSPDTFGQNRTTFSEAEAVVRPHNASSRRSLPRALKYVLGTIAALVLGYGLYHIVSHTKIDFSSTPPSQRWKNNFAATMNVKRLTTSGTARLAVVSPGGETFAYVTDESAKQSLWLRRIDSENVRLLVPPDDVYYSEISFSPDNQYVYYRMRRSLERTLYRVSVKGGETQKVSESVYNSFAFSPDGRRIVYDHQNPDNQQHSLFVAELGENSQIKSAETLFVLDLPNYFPGGISYSPDGKKIVYSRSTIEGDKQVINLFVYDFETKTNEKLGARDFKDVRGAAWRNNGEEIVVSAKENDASPVQLWLVTYPSGEVSRLTNDFTNYQGVSLTADSSTLVTAKSDTVSDLWTSELTESNQNYEAKARRITGGVDRQDGINGVNWTRDGRILYVAGAAGENFITLADRDGLNSRRFSTDASNPKLPSLTGDNRFLIYADEKEQKFSIQKFDTETGALVQVNSKYAVTPALAPDNRSIVYATLLAPSSNKLIVHRRPLEGGEETVLTNALSVRPVISPDGRLLACNYAGEETNDAWQIAVLPFDGDAASRFIKPFTHNFFRNPQERPLAWSPDGKFLYFLNNANNVANIFRVDPAGDAPPVQMTHFTTGELFDFALAPDGKSVAMARGSISRDVVIFKNSR